MDRLVCEIYDSTVSVYQLDHYFTMRKYDCTDNTFRESDAFIYYVVQVSMTSNTDLAVFTYAEWSVVWVYLFVYSTTTIMFCFMMSTFFSKGTIDLWIA